MMHSLGHTVFHYGGEGSDPDCTEHITTVTTAQRDEWFHSNWDKGEFPDMIFDASKEYWRVSNARAVIEIGKRIQPRDFICFISGHSQSAIANAFPSNISVEYGIGYEGTFTKFRCFESRAWQHHVYGIQGQRDGLWYDTVIGNYFDPIDFPMGEHKGDYFVFLGRLISRKNPQVAADICRRIGAKLIIAGQGVTLKEPGKIYSRELAIFGDHVEHIGVVGVEERAKLLGNAKALIMLTQYIAPFEGVHIEANLCLRNGQFVATNISQERIENIHAGGVVQAQTGHAIVEKSFERLYQGSMIKLKAMGMLPIETTPEHPILVAKMERVYSKENRIQKKLAYVRTITSTQWMPASTISIGDYLIFKKEKHVVDVDIKDVSEHCFRDTANSKNRQRFVPINEDILWLLGLYVAEGGGSSGCRLDLSNNDKERQLAEKACRIVRDNLSYTPAITTTKQGCYHASFGGSIFSRFLKHEFGAHCLMKTIPQWIIDLPCNKLKAFLDGYIAGDGCVLPTDGSLVLTTSSIILALQLQRAFTKFNILIPITLDHCEGWTEIEGKRTYRRDRYLLRSEVSNIFNRANETRRLCPLHLEDSENFYVRVTNIDSEQYTGPVSNLKTSDGTYCVSNVLVHNCGTPVITTDWGVFPDTVADGVNGYRVHTMGEAMWAARNVGQLDHKAIREKALARFSLDAVAPQYDEWFHRLYGLQVPGKDWYDESPGRFVKVVR